MVTMVMQVSSSSVLSTPPPTPPLEQLPPTLHTAPHQVRTHLLTKNEQPRLPRHHKKQPPPPPPRSEQTKIESGGNSSHVNVAKDPQSVAGPGESRDRGDERVSEDPEAQNNAPPKGTKTSSNMLPKFTKNAEDYFRGVSPMCRRLLDDMASIREAWGSEWSSLTYEEQCKILDQAIVDEATVRRYESLPSTGPDWEYFPKLQMHTGQNIIRDEKLSERGYTCTWRDEHSAPFSWHTRSQMDLTLDTPPETPMESSGQELSSYQLTNAASEHTTENGQASVGASFTSHTQKKPHRSRRTQSAFSWHYEPSLKSFKSNSQEFPDVVADSSRVDGGKHHTRSASARTHIIVQTEDATEAPSGFLCKLRGALCKFTTSCLPIHPNPALTHSVHGGPSPTPPELRPPHVLAQANAVSKGVTTPITLPITSQLPPDSLPPPPSTSGSSPFRDRSPVTPASEAAEVMNNNTITNNNTLLAPATSSNRIASNSVANRESCKANSAGESSNRNTGGKRRAPEPSNKKHAPPPPPVRKSSTTLSQAFPPPPSHLLTDAPTEPKNDNFNENLNILLKKQVMSELKASITAAPPSEGSNTSSETVKPVTEAPKEDVPIVDLSTGGENFIPKTGFDFLDNW